MSARHHPATGDGWDGILADGERIVWQGRPDATFVIGLAQIGGALFGLFFAGFALFWMVMAAQAGGIFWMFGLIHFGVGVSLTIGSFVWAPWRRRHTWYTLTDRRAFIATDIPFRGRQLKSWQIAPDTVLDYESGTPATIYFAKEYRQTKNGTRSVKVGFERISDGPAVYRLMNDIRDRRLTDARQQEAAQ